MIKNNNKNQNPKTVTSASAAGKSNRPQSQNHIIKASNATPNQNKINKQIQNMEPSSFAYERISSQIPSTTSYVTCPENYPLEIKGNMKKPVEEKRSDNKGILSSENTNKDNINIHQRRRRERVDNEIMKNIKEKMEAQQNNIHFGKCAMIGVGLTGKNENETSKHKSRDSSSKQYSSSIVPEEDTRTSEKKLANKVNSIKTNFSNPSGWADKDKGAKSYFYSKRGSVQSLLGGGTQNEWEKEFYSVKKENDTNNNNSNQEIQTTTNIKSHNLDRNLSPSLYPRSIERRHYREGEIFNFPLEKPSDQKRKKCTGFVYDYEDCNRYNGNNIKNKFKEEENEEDNVGRAGCNKVQQQNERHGFLLSSSSSKALMKVTTKAKAEEPRQRNLTSQGDEKKQQEQEHVSKVSIESEKQSANVHDKYWNQNQFRSSLDLGYQPNSENSLFKSQKPSEWINFRSGSMSGYSSTLF